MNKRLGNITAFLYFILVATREFSGVFMIKVPLFYFEETEQKRNPLLTLSLIDISKLGFNEFNCIQHESIRMGL